MSASALVAPGVTPTTTENLETFPVRRRWTASDFQRMAETGFLDPNARLELLDGELFEMAPIGSFHAGTVDILTGQLVQAAARRAIVRVQSPIVLDDYSQPQPDLALLRPRSDYYLNAHPRAEDVLLLIEVSDSTLRYDREVKVPHYAKAGVPEVWILDIAHQRLEIYRRPSAEGYRQILYPELQEQVAPVLLPELVFSVEQLFIANPPV